MGLLAIANQNRLSRDEGCIPGLVVGLGADNLIGVDDHAAMPVLAGGGFELERLLEGRPDR
jgi:hypothetical protein